MKEKNLKVIILIIIIWGLFYDIAFIILFDKKYPEIADMKSVCVVVSNLQEKENSNEYIIKVLSSNLKNTKNTKIILYTSKSTDFKYGDILKIDGKFSKPNKATNYKGFDYRKYLKQCKIYGSIYISEPQRLSHKSNILEKVYILKQKLLEKIDLIYKDNEKSAFLKGILIGDTSQIDDETEENFRNSSMSHILAISGMHVAYVIVGIKFILDKFINKQKLKNIILISVLLFFAILTGLSASCLRACIMSSILFLSQNLYRKNNFYITILFTFLILIFINPYNIFSVGMWLSFFGTLGIVLFQKFFQRFFECKLKIKSKYIKSVLNIIWVSVSAQILILPIMIYCFNNISLTFFISNLLIYFLIGPILAFGYISIILGLFFIPIGNILAVIENFLIFLIFQIAKFCSKLPFSKILVVTPNFFYIILYYVIISIIVILFNKNRIKFLKLILSNKIFIILKRRYIKIAYSTILLIVVINIVKIYPNGLKIHCVDVGQGDCTVIQTEYGKNIIIDGGNNQKYDYGKNVVVPYLLDRRIKNIDYLMVSHFDSDHCGGLFEVVRQLNVKNVIIGKQDGEYENCDRFINLVKSKKINLIIVQKGNIIKIDKNTNIEILWPNPDKMISDNGINNNSIVARLNFKDFSMLFTGDIEKIAEEELVKEYMNTNFLDVDVLKVAHHGSKSSSIDKIIEEITPKICMIGVGKDNKYGHPNKDVISRLENIGSRVFRTDRDGEISVEIDSKGSIRKVYMYVK